MGQYFLICNLDKREFLAPGDFGHGVKLAGLGLNGGGAMAGLALLHAVSGTSYFTGGPIHGRWANDRIAIMGDYFEGVMGGITWSQEYWAGVSYQEDGWVDITEHVIAALNEDWELGLPLANDTLRSILHADGTITALRPA